VAWPHPFCIHHWTLDGRGAATIIIFIWHNQAQKYVLNCDVSFANGKRHQAYGHVTYFGHALIVNVTWPYAWWRLPLANEMSQLGTYFCAWLCHMNIIIIASPTWWTFTNKEYHCLAPAIWHQHHKYVPQVYLLACYGKIRPKTTKTCIHQSNKCIITQKNTTKLKLGLVASYDIWPRNGEGLFLF